MKMKVLYLTLLMMLVGAAVVIGGDNEEPSEEDFEDDAFDSEVADGENDMEEQAENDPRRITVPCKSCVTCGIFKGICHRRCSRHARNIKNRSCRKCHQCSIARLVRKIPASRRRWRVPKPKW